MNIKESKLYKLYDSNKDKPLISDIHKLRERMYLSENVARARKNYKKMCSIKRDADSPVNVVFLIQYLVNWGKSEQLYRIMEADERFNPVLLCIPYNLDVPDNENETFIWFGTRGYNCINASLGGNHWYDLKGLYPEYVFYARPYNAVIPEVYSSHIVSAYAKVCSYMYGYLLADEDIRNCINRDFYDYCYTYYACSADDNKYFVAKKHSAFQRSVYLGYPGLSRFAGSEENKTTSWGSWTTEHTKFRVLWTPRWSTDERVGGSNFFKYKEAFLSYTGKNEDVEFMIRPHPLTFVNFIKTGEMTEQEVKDFKILCETMENLSLDEDFDYVETFLNTDVLISDYSAIMAEFFATGKPVIYCDANSKYNQDYTESAKVILEGTYIAKNFEDIEKYIEMLRSGIDPLKENRIQAKEKLWGYKLEHCPQMIADDIWNDSRRSRSSNNTGR